MADQRTVTRTRRVRRSQEEVRRLLLKAAQERFAAHGYAGVSTRTIAADAGAAESQIFTYFGSKAGLFEAAVLEPFNEFHEEFNRHWAVEPKGDVLDETRVWVAGIYHLFRRYRPLILALIATDRGDLDLTESGATTALSRLLPPVGEDPAVADRHDWDGYVAAGRQNLWDGYDVPTTVRFSFGAMLAMTVLDDLLYDRNSPRPTDEYLIEQISQLLVGGFRGPR